MGKDSCRVTPMVKNNLGEEVDSNLYQELNDILTFAGNGGRANTLPLYSRTEDERFNKDMRERGAFFDENGEVHPYDYLINTDNGKSIPVDAIVKHLNHQNGFIDSANNKQWIDNTRENRNKLFDKITAFNDSPWNRGYSAKLEVEDNKVNGLIEENTPDSNTNNKQLKFYSNLSKRLENILKGWGIGIDILNEADEKFTNGYVDFSESARTADGLISLIKIANSRRGEEALPEEFSHIVVRSMLNTPLIQRMINDLIRRQSYQEILGEEYEEYKTKYNNDERKLAEEAVGKLLANELQKRYIKKGNDTLLDRVINTFCKIWSKFDATQIIGAIRNSDKGLGILANQLLKGNIHNIKPEKLGNDTMYNILDSIKKKKNIWDNLYELTLKRQQIYEIRGKDLGLTPLEAASFDKSFISQGQDALIKILKQSTIEKDKWNMPLVDINEFRLSALLSTLEIATEDIQRLEQLLNTLEEDKSSNLNFKCAKIRMINDYIDSYIKLRSYYTELLAKNKETLNDLFEGYPDLEENLATIKEALNNIGDLDVLRERVKNIAQPIFIKALSQVCPEGAMLRLNGEIVDIETLVIRTDDDLGYMNMFLQSMANTPDDIAKLYDHIVKQKKGMARQEAIDIKRKIIAAGKKLDSKFGFNIRQQEFMYRHTPDGNIYLNPQGMPEYIKKYNEEKWLEDYENISNQYISMYQGEENADDLVNQKLIEWHQTHSIKVRNEWFPNSEMYSSEEYKKLTAAQKEFYDVFMESKAQLDKYLPKRASDLHKVILVRKEGLERILTANNGNEFWQSLKDYFADLFKRKETDDEFGTPTRAALQTFSGEELKRLPIYYQYKSATTDISNYSMDCVSNLILYAQMATNYKALNQVINVLEVGKDLLKYREAIRKDNGNALYETIKYGGEKTLAFLTRTDANSKFRDRLEAFMDMQVYGRMKADKTNIKGLSTSKLGDLWASLIALNTTAIKFSTAVVNVLQGLHQINIEMFAHQFYSTGDIIKANAYYWTYVWKSIMNLGNPAKTSKLALWSEDFNVMQEYESSMHEVDFYKRNRFYRLMNTSSLFFMTNAGEHYLQHITALALANRDYIIDDNGNHISVFDAYEMKWIDPTNHSLGGYLALKSYINNTTGNSSQIYKTQDGKVIVTMEQLKARQQDYVNKGINVDLYSDKLLHEGEIAEWDFKNNFTRKSAKINQDLHGIYNNEDKNMIQRYAIGRLAMMYRKHIVPNFNKRWKKEGYDFDLGVDTVGFQRSAANFWGKFFRELFKGDENGHRHGIFHTYSTLNDVEKANMRRNLANLIDFWSTLVLIKWLDDDDSDDEDDWYNKMLLNVLYRQRAEIAFFTPSSVFTPYNFVSDWLRIVKEPIIGMSWAETYLGLIQLLNPLTWTTEIESGKYKGYTKAEKIILRTIPFKKQIEDFKDPDYTYFK